jgi:hypothetical protein
MASSSTQAWLMVVGLHLLEDKHKRHGCVFARQQHLVAASGMLCLGHTAAVS